MYVCMYVCMYVRKNTLTFTCRRYNIYISYVHTYIISYMHTYIAYIHTYIHTYIGFPRLYGTVRKVESAQLYRVRFDDTSISTETLHRYFSSPYSSYIYIMYAVHKRINIPHTYIHVVHTCTYLYIP